MFCKCFLVLVSSYHVSSSYKDNSSVRLGSHHMTSFNLYYLLTGPISKNIDFRNQGFNIRILEGHKLLIHTMINNQVNIFFWPSWEHHHFRFLAMMIDLTLFYSFPSNLTPTQRSNSAPCWKIILVQKLQTSKGSYASSLVNP